MVDNPKVVLLPRQVEVLPLVGVVVVKLQPHQVGHVVVGSEAHVPAQPGCTPASSICRCDNISSSCPVSQ